MGTAITLLIVSVGLNILLIKVLLEKENMLRRLFRGVRGLDKNSFNGFIGKAAVYNKTAGDYHESDAKVINKITKIWEASHAKNKAVKNAAPQGEERTSTRDVKISCRLSLPLYS